MPSNARDKGFHRFGQNFRNAGLNIQPAPAVRTNRCGLPGEPTPQANYRIRFTMDLKAG